MWKTSRPARIAFGRGKFARTRLEQGLLLYLSDRRDVPAPSLIDFDSAASTLRKQPLCRRALRALTAHPDRAVHSSASQIRWPPKGCPSPESTETSPTVSLSGATG